MPQHLSLKVPPRGNSGGNATGPDGPGDPDDWDPFAPAVWLELARELGDGTPEHFQEVTYDWHEKSFLQCYCLLMKSAEELRDRQCLGEAGLDFARAANVLEYAQSTAETERAWRSLIVDARYAADQAQTRAYVTPPPVVDPASYASVLGAAPEFPSPPPTDNYSDEARKRIIEERSKLYYCPSEGSEAASIRKYLKIVESLPWNYSCESVTDINVAREILEADHDGLAKIKDEIVKEIAVLSWIKKPLGKVLCLVGPPGVGKTSIALSIAHATGRPLVKKGLGGVRDEAEIRGFTSTYIGSKPGPIINGMRDAGCDNPVFVLDEIDKLGHSGAHGDPSAALLEVLDPAQNSKFKDHYLDLDYDLSKVMFICTANTLDTIPTPLLDRLEVLSLSGYTEDEKLNIARKHLISKAVTKLNLGDIRINWDKDALRLIINSYTREAGVRELERAILSICRSIICDRVRGDTREALSIDAGAVRKWLGPPKHFAERRSTVPQVGNAHGLAWTAAGGTLMHVQVKTVPQRDRRVLTGKLGDMIKESVEAAHTYLESTEEFGTYLATDRGIHVHLPDAATPKDGPSAGVAITCAMASAYSGRPINPAVAMTGEVDVFGNVLRVGGVKEKLTAAHQQGIYEVFIPRDNAPAIEELDDCVRRQLTVHLLDHVDEALEKILLPKPSEVTILRAA